MTSLQVNIYLKRTNEIAEHVWISDPNERESASAWSVCGGTAWGLVRWSTVGTTCNEPADRRSLLSTT